MAYRVNNEQLERCQPRREYEADTCGEREKLRHPWRVGVLILDAQQRQHEERHIERDTPTGNGSAEKNCPLARVNRLTRADAAAQVSDFADLVEKQVESDKDPGER